MQYLFNRNEFMSLKITPSLSNLLQLTKNYKQLCLPYFLRLKWLNKRPTKILHAWSVFSIRFELIIIPLFHLIRFDGITVHAYTIRTTGRTSILAWRWRHENNLNGSCQFDNPMSVTSVLRRRTLSHWYFVRHAGISFRGGLSLLWQPTHGTRCMAPARNDECLIRSKKDKTV